MNAVKKGCWLSCFVLGRCTYLPKSPSVRRNTQFCLIPPTLGKTKGTLKVGLLEYCWNPSRSTPRGLTTVPFAAKSTRNNSRGACEKALLEGLLAVCPNRILGFSHACCPKTVFCTKFCPNVTLCTYLQRCCNPLF